jgi:hypothetical protein
MKWAPAVIDGVEYDLSHLHPFDFTLELAAKGSLGPLTIYIRVSFGLHCFTRKVEPETPEGHQYRDSRELRAFCLERHEMSLRLPGIVQGLSERRCYEAQYNNYMTFEILDRLGQQRHYQMYFRVDLTKRGEQRLLLFVQSAFEREQPKKVQRMKPRLFKAICADALRKKK